MCDSRSEGILYLYIFTGDAAWDTTAQSEYTELVSNCRLPLWSDALFHIEREPRLMVMIQDTSSFRWLRYCGTARIADSTGDRYAAIHIAPERIDQIGETQGWGAREH